MADRELSADLVLIRMVDYDVILGMDFLGKYNATIECKKKKVVFQPDGELSFEYMSQSTKEPRCIISSLEAQRLMSKGYSGYLAYMVATEHEETVRFEDVPVVREFPEVFPEELQDYPQTAKSPLK